MRLWKVGQQNHLKIDGKPLLMGIVNITPDSFSDGGKNFSYQKAQQTMQKYLQEGATIFDIGGESTRPNGAPVTAEEEQNRVLPVIEQALKDFPAIFSVDTYRADTAEKALQKGAHIINDIWGLQYDRQMAPIIAHYRAGIVIMHNSRDRDCIEDPLEDQKYFFEKSLNIAHKAGIKEEQIVLDPGFGFGKNFDTNKILLQRANELLSFGFPLLAATSRKAFLGKIGNEDEAKNRDNLTAASSLLLRQAGFSIFRVHNVKLNYEALRMADIAKNNKTPPMES